MMLENYALFLEQHNVLKSLAKDLPNVEFFNPTEARYFQPRPARNLFDNGGVHLTDLGREEFQHKLRSRLNNCMQRQPNLLLEYP